MALAPQRDSKEQRLPKAVLVLLLLEDKQRTRLLIVVQVAVLVAVLVVARVRVRAAPLPAPPPLLLSLATMSCRARAKPMTRMIGYTYTYEGMRKVPAQHTCAAPCLLYTGYAPQRYQSTCMGRRHTLTYGQTSYACPCVPPDAQATPATTQAL